MATGGDLEKISSFGYAIVTGREPIGGFIGDEQAFAEQGYVTSFSRGRLGVAITGGCGKTGSRLYIE